jgi:hypothetical protein
MRSTGATDPYPGNEASGQPNPRRAVEAATLVIIAATVIAVVASSWPILITWIDDERPATAKPGIARALRARGWAIGPPGAKGPQRFGPRQHSPIPHGDRVPGLETLRIPPGSPTQALAGAIAKPLTIVQLLDRADPDGRPVISVNPDETLMVVREMTPWVLLAVKRDGKVEFGWTTRSQVAISR